MPEWRSWSPNAVNVMKPEEKLAAGQSILLS